MSNDKFLDLCLMYFERYYLPYVNRLDCNRRHCKGSPKERVQAMISAIGEAKQYRDRYPEDTALVAIGVLDKDVQFLEALSEELM